MRRKYFYPKTGHGKLYIQTFQGNQNQIIPGNCFKSAFGKEAVTIALQAAFLHLRYLLFYFRLAKRLILKLYFIKNIALGIVGDNIELSVSPLFRNVVVVPAYFFKGLLHKPCPILPD